MNLDTIPRFALPYSSGDFAAAVRSLCRRRMPSPEPFSGLVGGGGTLFWTSSGRQALWLALRALALEPGSGVAVPLFNDPSVPRAVVEAGLRPVFVDVDERTLTMDPESLAAAKGSFSAVVAVHLFGQLADMHRIVKVAGAAPIIEDTAHAPLSLLGGRQAGSFGCAHFYSFASTKYWPAGGGGMLVVRDRAMAPGVSADAARLESPAAGTEWRNLLLQTAKSAVFSRLLYGAVGVPLRRRVEREGILEPVLSHSGIHRHQAEGALRHVAHFRQRVEDQRRNSLFLLSLIEKELGSEGDVVLPKEWPGATYNYHIFPVLVEDEKERNLVQQAMIEKLVDSSRIYYNVVDRSRSLGYQRGCPVSESIASRLLTLPNYAGLNEKDISRVARVFVAALRQVRSAGGRIRSRGLRSPSTVASIQP